MSRRMFNVSVSGLGDTLRMLNDRVATEEVGRVTETYARKIANDSANNAPVDTGALKGSLSSSPQKEEETVWTVGSDLPYALRQEYEHASKKGFVRKAVWNNRDPYRNKIDEVLRNMGR
ncbi:hypothetical protein MHI57_24570 [Cytobacillus sp. FSL K6-0129]|uniref:hypothetical protein n=1 Tax=Cytobacillus sp. FSL K6-0129 TaxID=2921421 RepID=UPI0030F4E86F